MEINEFVDKFADQFDDIDTEDFSADTDFRANDEWSSLTALSVIAMVDEEYDVTLKGDDIIQSKTIGDLFNIVKSRL